MCRSFLVIAPQYNASRIKPYKILPTRTGILSYVISFQRLKLTFTNFTVQLIVLVHYKLNRERTVACVRIPTTKYAKRWTVVLCVVDPMETNVTTSMLSQFVGVDGGGNRADFIPARKCIVCVCVCVCV